MKRFLIIILLLGSIHTFAQMGVKGLKATSIVDPHGSIASYTWKQTSGPANFVGFSITDAQGSQAGLGDSITVRTNIAGLYTINATITDNQGNQDVTTTYIQFTAYQNTKPKIIVSPGSSPENPIIVPIK